MSDLQTRAARRELMVAPASLRQIARAADVPHSTLARIVRNELGASGSVAEAVATALDLWSGDLADVVSEILVLGKPHKYATNNGGY